MVLAGVLEDAAFITGEPVEPGAWAADGLLLATKLLNGIMKPAAAGIVGGVDEKYPTVKDPLAEGFAGPVGPVGAQHSAVGGMVQHGVTLGAQHGAAAAQHGDGAYGFPQDIPGLHIRTQKKSTDSLALEVRDGGWVWIASEDADGL